MEFSNWQRVRLYCGYNKKDPACVPGLPMVESINAAVNSEVGYTFMVAATTKHAEWASRVA